MMKGIGAEAFQGAIDGSDQAIVLVPRHDTVPGYANAVARGLLGLGDPTADAATLRSAIDRLAGHCERPPALLKAEDDDGDPGPEVWSLPLTGRHWRVSRTPLEADGFCGHTWMFADVTGDVVGRAQYDAMAAQLRAATQRYEFVAEYTSDIVLTADSAGIITWIAPSVSRVLEWQPAEVVGNHLSTFIHPEDLPGAIEVAPQVFSVAEAEAEPVGSLLRCRAASGEYQWMLGQAGPVFHDGQHRGIVAGLRSVEDLVESREESERSRQLLRASMDGLLTPLVLWQAIRNSAGRVVDFRAIDANRATTEYLGLSRQELLSSTILKLLPGLADTELLPAMVACVDEGRPLIIEDFFYHHELLKDDRWYNVEGSRVLDSVALSWHDITENRLSRLRLAESEAHYRELSQRTEELRAQLDALLTDGSVLALRFSRSGEILWMSGSAVRLLGMRPEDLTHAPGGWLVHGDDEPSVGSVIARVLSTGEAETVTVRLRHADVGYRVFEGTIFQAEEGVLQATVTDITEREEADQLRQLVVAVASHELRTPLAFLFATLSMMQDGTIDAASPTGRDLLDRMVASAARLGRLADSLLRMQRLQNPDADQNIEPLAVGECVQEAARSVEWARDIELRFHDDTAGRSLLINGDLLTQAVINLVGNAVKFSPDGAPVDVHVTCTDDRVRVSVRDYGRGIPADQRPMVFDSFFQVRADDRLHGIGLGLPIVRRIAELHQGRVRVMAPSEGPGSIFDLEMCERPFSAA